jgi:hypothetical protein
MIRFTAFARSALALAALAALGAAMPASAQGVDGLDRRILIQNRSAQNILYVRGSPTSHSSYGEDRIPDRIIGRGESSIVDFDNGTRDCMYDLRVTLANGRNVDRMNVNVCRVSRWTINRGGSAIQ